MHQTMKTVRIDAYGDNDVIQLVERPRPEPDVGEVRVAIRAAGVNPIDWKIRNGAGQRMGMTPPIDLGSEMAGIVDAVGQGVERFVVGDAVFGMVTLGAFAEYIVVPETVLARKPDRLDFIQSAAVPLGALTAWQALFGIAKLQMGERLLITGGSGGVGSLAIQIAKAHGAHVTAMASGRNESFVRSLGADVFID
jgi:NADPH:quinone reductase-like Zn-dependent oxidoreductase